MEVRPKFFTALCQNVGDKYQKKGMLYIIPWWLLIGLSIGAAVAFCMPVHYWSDESWEVATTFYAGFLAFNGLTLALGWGVFSKIYEILTRDWFAAFLRRNGILGVHLFFIDAVHGVLILSAVCSGVALFTVLLPLPLIADRMVMGAVIGSSFWSLVKALSSTKLMNDLVWEVAHAQLDDKGHIREVGGEGQGHDHVR